MERESGTTQWTKAFPKGGMTRLAPTPSGYLHRGNAINFLLTQRLAKALGAKVLLRIDDLDAERVRPEFVEDIFRSLEWLGIGWDLGPSGPEEHSVHWSQGLRLDRYRHLADQLRGLGHLFACRCTRATVEVCTCRAERWSFDAPDTVWRLIVPHGIRIELPGLVGSAKHVELASVLDGPVILQRNGRASYQIASLEDDVSFGVTFVVRGMDLQPSSACQRYVAQLLSLDPFLGLRFLHHELEMDDEGRKLSKSDGASSLKAMREAGLGPDELHQTADRLLGSLMS